MLNIKNVKYQLKTVHPRRKSDTPLLSVTKTSCSLNLAFRRNFYPKKKKNIFYQVVKVGKDYYMLFSEEKRDFFYCAIFIKQGGFQSRNMSLQKNFGALKCSVRYKLIETKTNDTSIKAFKMEKCALDNVIFEETDNFEVH